MTTTKMETTKTSNIMTTTEMETTNTANMMTITKKTSMQFPHTFYNKHIACTVQIFKEAYFTHFALNESYSHPLNTNAESKIYNMHEFCKTLRIS